MAFKPLDNFLLVGGTALALQLGHRQSIDIDLFSTESFDEEILIQQLAENYSIEYSNKGIRTLNLQLNGIKTDILGYKYPLIGTPVIEDGIRMMGRKDISAMKLGAISGRGKKKDFYDLFFLLKEFSISEMLSFYSQKFNVTNVFHIIKSIDYFVDAEIDADIKCLENISWKEVKKKIETDLRSFLKS
jgi:hypothetical protein